MITASAPISKDVLNFLRCAFCCTIYEAYGLTETSGPTTVTHETDGKAGHVGGPLVNQELKVQDIPEMNYFSSNDLPQGELCVKGINVFKGYYKEPEKTKEAMDKDGWFHTGDVAEI